jgi:hypothetical protein
MKKLSITLALVLALAAVGAMTLRAQDTAPASDKDAKASRAYSGMYTFLKEGEFVQVTVEDEGRVTGFISRYGDGDSDKGAFLNQFFKTGKLDGNKLNFTTDVVHGVSFDFKGTVERGEGKAPSDESYFVLRGILTENSSDANKKVTSHARDVAFKLFPQDASPAAVNRK